MRKLKHDMIVETSKIDLFKKPRGNRRGEYIYNLACDIKQYKKGTKLSDIARDFTRMLDENRFVLGGNKQLYDISKPTIDIIDEQHIYIKFACEVRINEDPPDYEYVNLIFGLISNI